MSPSCIVFIEESAPPTIDQETNGDTYAISKRLLASSGSKCLAMANSSGQVRAALLSRKSIHGSARTFRTIGSAWQCRHAHCLSSRQSRCGTRDAELLAPEFHPMEPGALTDQSPFTAWLRRCDAGRDRIEASPRIYPPLGTGAAIRGQSRQRFGRPRNAVEARLYGG
jgi:hypothetical protein